MRDLKGSCAHLLHPALHQRLPRRRGPNQHQLRLAPASMLTPLQCILCLLLPLLLLLGLLQLLLLARRLRQQELQRIALLLQPQSRAAQNPNEPTQEKAWVLPTEQARHRS